LFKTKSIKINSIIKDSSQKLELELELELETRKLDMLRIFQN